MLPIEYIPRLAKEPYPELLDSETAWGHESLGISNVPGHDLCFGISAKGDKSSLRPQEMSTSASPQVVSVAQVTPNRLNRRCSFDAAPALSPSPRAISGSPEHLAKLQENPSRRSACKEGQFQVPRRLCAIATSTVAAALVIGLGGCAFKKPFTEMLWPAPPLTPRIKFVGVLRNRDDLGRSTAELFAEALVGKKTPESLVQPMGVAVSRDGTRLYVTDYAKPAVLVFDFTANRMSPFGSEGISFENPLGIAVDDADNIYIVESVPKRIGVYDASGNRLRVITHESLERPTGIAVDSGRQRIYVADSASRLSPNHAIRVFGTDGSYISSFGRVGNKEGEFSFPSYLALDHDGNLYVTDTLNGRVQKFDPDGRYLMSFGQYGDAFGMFNKPKGVVLDSFGNLYAVDAAWSNVQIFNQKGEVLLFFGGRGRFPGLLFNPTGIAMDKDNRIFVSDAFNSRISIYQLINTTAADSVIPLPSKTEEGGDNGRPKQTSALQ